MEALLNLPSTGRFLRASFDDARDAHAPSSPLDERSPPHPDDRPVLDHCGHASRASGATVRPYLCDHNSAPPAHQHITTDETNVLIRALTHRGGRDELAGRASGHASTSGARRATTHAPRPSSSAAPSSGPPAARAASNSLGRRPAPPERASKRPALVDQSGVAPDASALRHLETLDAASLRDLLRARGIRGAAVDLAGRGALLARARQALGEERSAGGGDGAGGGGGVPRSGFERPSR